MWQVGTICFCLVLMVLVESEGEIIGQGKSSQKDTEKRLGETDVLWTEKRGGKGKFTTTLKKKFQEGVRCMLQENLWEQVPKEVVASEWDKSYKVEEWFQKDKCFRKIYVTILYITKPKMKKTLNNVVQICSESIECERIPENKRQKLIQMFSNATCSDATVNHNFSSEYENLPQVMELIDMRCDMRNKQRSKLQTTFWKQRSKRSKDTDAGTDILLHDRRGELENTREMSSDGFLSLIEYARCLSIFAIPDYRTTKHCKLLFTQVPVYVDALVKGYKKKVKASEQLFKDANHEVECKYLRWTTADIDSGVQQNDTLVQQFLSNNMDFVSGFKELIRTHCI